VLKVGLYDAVTPRLGGDEVRGFAATEFAVGVELRPRLRLVAVEAEREYVGAPSFAGQGGPKFGAETVGLVEGEGLGVFGFVGGPETEGVFPLGDGMGNNPFKELGALAITAGRGMESVPREPGLGGLVGVVVKSSQAGDAVVFDRSPELDGRELAFVVKGGVGSGSDRGGERRLVFVFPREQFCGQLLCFHKRVRHERNEVHNALTLFQRAGLGQKSGAKRPF